MKRKFATLRSRIETAFEWLSIMVIPSLFISSVVISLELLPGVATFQVQGWPVGQIAANLATACMMLSIEAAMVGCRLIAGHAKKDGDTAVANKYNVFGLLFFLLFVATISFQALHIPSNLDQYLTLVRCIAAGLYAYLCHGDDNHVAPPAPPQEQIDRLSSLERSLSQLQNSVSQSPNVEAIIQSLKTDFSQTLENLSHDSIATMKTLIDDKLATVAMPLARAPEADTQYVEEKEEGDSTPSVLEEQSDKKGEKTILTRESIQEYILSHPGATQREIADALGTTTRTIQRKMTPVSTGETTQRTLKIVK